MTKKTTSLILVIVIGALISGCIQSQEEKPSRPEVCPQVYNPVCGKDGQTYSHDCVAKQKGAKVDYPGECRKEPISKCGDGVCDEIEKKRNICPEDCGKPTTTIVATTLPTTLTTSLPITTSQDSPFGAHGRLEILLEADDVGIQFKRNAAKEGLLWDLMEPNYDSNYYWDDFDNFLDEANDLNLDLMITVLQMNTLDQNSCGPCVIGDKGKCERKNPCNWDKYETFLKTAIARYKDRITYWQIENEPAAGHFYAGTAQEYAELLAMSYKTIKDVCPDCEIVIAGMADTHPEESREYYSQIFDSLKTYPECSENGCFDIFDIHTGGDLRGGYQAVEQTYSDTVSLLSQYNYADKPLWSTEYGPLRSPEKCSKITDNMGHKLIKLYSAGLESGFKKLFWRVAECPSWLVDHGKKTDPYYAYKTLISKLEGFSSVQKLSEGQYKFMVNNKPVYVLWSDTGKGKVPDEISGTVKVTGYLGNEQVMQASAIKLNESPVFVEGKPTTTTLPYEETTTTIPAEKPEEENLQLGWFIANYGSKDDYEGQSYMYEYLMKPTGAAVKRLNLWWHLVQSEQGGEYDFNTFDRSGYDQYQLACDKGLIPFIGLSADVRWIGESRSYGQGDYPDGDEDGYQGYVAAVVDRYNGDGDSNDAGCVINYYEIENEVAGIYWHGTAEEYVKLIQLSIEVIREHNPSAKIAISFAEGTRSGAEYLRSMFEYGLESSDFDIIDSHILHDESMTYPEDIISRYEEVLSDYSASGKEYWSTESCINSAFVSSYKDRNYGGSEDTQARDIIKMFVNGFASGYRVILEHTMIGDTGGDNPPFYGCGVYREDLSKKPSFYAYQVLADKIQGSVFQEMIDLGTDVAAYKFSKDGKDIYVLWMWTKQDKIIDLSSYISGDVTATDYQGNEETGDASSIQLSQYPVFIEEK